MNQAGRELRDPSACVPPPQVCTTRLAVSDFLNCIISGNRRTLNLDLLVAIYIKGQGNRKLLLLCLLASEQTKARQETDVLQLSPRNLRSLSSVKTTLPSGGEADLVPAVG